MNSDRSQTSRRQLTRAIGGIPATRRGLPSMSCGFIVKNVLQVIILRKNYNTNINVYNINLVENQQKDHLTLETGDFKLLKSEYRRRFRDYYDANTRSALLYDLKVF